MSPLEGRVAACRQHVGAVSAEGWHNSECWIPGRLRRIFTRGEDQKDAGYGTSASKQNESMSVSVFQHRMVEPERGERIPRWVRLEHDAGA